MPKVSIKTDNLTLDVPVGYAIIDMCDEHQTSILFSCRGATCGTCMIRVLAGAQNLSPKQEDEKDLLETLSAASNERLACQCKVLGDVTIDVAE